MRELLSKEMNRRVTILECLNLANDWVPSSKLAKVANCSQKTVINDIQFLADYWPSYLSIESSKKKGIRMSSPPGNTIRNIYSDIIQESEVFSFMEKLFYEPHQPAEYWLEKMYFSKSTLYRISNHMDHSLVRRGMFMQRKPYYISSTDERQTRFFFTELFLEIYGVHYWPFQVNKKKIITFVTSMLDELGMELSESKTLHLCYLLVVSLIRKSQGFFLDKAIMKRQTDTLQQVLKQKQEELEKIIESLQWKLSATWFEDISYTLFFYFYSWDNEREKQRISQKIVDSIFLIKEALDIPLTTKDTTKVKDLLIFIYTRYKVYPYQGFVLYNQYAFTATSIKKSYVTYSEVTRKVLGLLEKSTKFPWLSEFEDEILYWIMACWENLPIYLDQKRKRVKVLIISDLGCEHAQLIGNLVQGNFSEKVEIIVNKESVIEHSISEILVRQKIDVIISNFSLTDFPLTDFPMEDTVVVDLIPTLRNWTDIRRSVEKHRLVLPEEIPFLQK